MPTVINSLRSQYLRVFFLVLTCLCPVKTVSVFLKRLELTSKGDMSVSPLQMNVRQDEYGRNSRLRLLIRNRPVQAKSQSHPHELTAEGRPQGRGKGVDRGVDCGPCYRPWTFWATRPCVQEQRCVSLGLRIFSVPKMLPSPGKQTEK